MATAAPKGDVEFWSYNRQSVAVNVKHENMFKKRMFSTLLVISLLLTIRTVIITETKPVLLV